MKIIFVAPFGLGQKTTVWARILPLAKIVHSSTQPPSQVTILIPPWDTPEDSGKSWMDEGVTIKNVSLTGGLPLTIWRMMRFIRKEKPDIVHICKPRAHAGIVQWLLWMQRTLRPFLLGDQSKYGPLILLDVDDWEQAWNEMNNHNALLSRFLTWQEEWGIRHADGISAASRWLDERAQSYTVDTPILYLPNGVSEPEANQLTVGDHTASNRGSSHNGSKPLKILYLTRYVEVAPGWLADFWIHLCQRLEENQDADLNLPDDKAKMIELIVAGGPLQPKLDRTFRNAVEKRIDEVIKEGLTLTVATRTETRLPNQLANVEWLGLVDRETIDQLYAECACAIFPASPVPLQQAKCSVRLATTLLQGVPVVASAVGQQREYGANGAAKLVAEDAKPEEFADMVYEVLTNPRQREEISQQARHHLLETYRWERLGHALVHFYEEVLSSGPRR